MLRKVWKTFNVSTILILPLFWDITSNVIAKSKKHSGVRIPFIQLCIEYGLKNTYLYKNKKFNGVLYLVFDKEHFNQNKNLTTSKYISICELLVDCEYFYDIEITNDEVIVGLTIPKRFLGDIVLIEQGLYSKVSSIYKEEIRIKQDIVPITPNELALYVSSKNIGYFICIKHRSIKEQLEKELKTKINEDNEYYEKFSSKKENLTIG